MIRFIKISLLAVGVVAASLVSSPAVAATVSSSQEIIITATVLPAQTIIINESGQITKIISNSHQSGIVPTVYENNVSVKNARELTPEISAKAATLLENKFIKPGVLYDQFAFKKSATTTGSSKLNFFDSKIFYLR